MADNLTSPIPNATQIATKDLGGVHIPKNAIVDQAGADAVGLVTASPAVNTILGRLKAIADAVVSLIAATLKVSAESLPLPTGAATASKQDGIIAAIGGATYFPETQPVSGTVGISGPVAVTGTFFQETQPISAAALPLPSGASTAAKQDAVKASIDATALVEAPFPVTPHASNALSRPIKAIAIKEAGTVVYRPTGGSEDVTVDLPAGLFPLPATHIRATSTATGLTGF